MTTPLPSTTRSRSAGSNSGSPKKSSPPAASRLTRARRITPAVAEETPPMPLRSALPSSEVRCWMTARRSLVSRSGRPCWSAQWKISPRVDSWVSLRSSTFDSRIGPNCVSVARIGIAELLPPSERNSTGYAVGVQSSPVSLTRDWILALSSPGLAMPERSPLTSASSTGTPASDSWPGEPLQRLRLARAGGARDEAVPVERRERDADLRVGIDLTVDDDGAELQCPALRRVPGSDLLCGVRRVLSHEP